MIDALIRKEIVTPAEDRARLPGTVYYGSTFSDLDQTPEHISNITPAPLPIMPELSDALSFVAPQPIAA